MANSKSWLASWQLLSCAKFPHRIHIMTIFHILLYPVLTQNWHLHNKYFSNWLLAKYILSECHVRHSCFDINAFWRTVYENFLSGTGHVICRIRHCASLLSDLVRSGQLPGSWARSLAVTVHIGQRPDHRLSWTTTVVPSSVQCIGNSLYFLHSSFHRNLATNSTLKKRTVCAF